MLDEAIGYIAQDSLTAAQVGMIKEAKKKVPVPFSLPYTYVRWSMNI